MAVTKKTGGTYVRSWKRELDIYNQLEGGRILGHEEGREEGLKEGHQKGLEEGRQKGLEEGRQKGLEEGLHEAARNMEALGFDEEIIMKVTGLRKKL